MTTKRSPFPGMDPWLEEHWGDVHQRMVLYAADSLQARLPADLRARVEERVFLESPGQWRRSIAPDVRVDERRTVGPHRGSAADPVSPAAGNGGVAVAQPLLIHAPTEPTTEGYVEIRETGPGRRLVTVIEVLSRANKVGGGGQALYTKKQGEVVRGGANLVEIDLLRRGDYVLAVPWDNLPSDVHRHYKACVTRGDRPGVYEFYPLPLRARLPAIAIPLRPTDADVPLDLQALLDQAYANGGYDDIDYARAPSPALDPDEEAWADELLRARGLRASKSAS